MMLHEWPHCAFIWLYLINRKERQRINLSAKIQVVVFYSLAWAVWSYLNWNINSQIYRRDAYSYFQRWIPHTVSNKNIHLPLFEIGMFFFADISGTTWAIKKVFYIYLHPCLKSFQMKTEFLKSGHKISWYFQKHCFARKK